MFEYASWRYKNKIDDDPAKWNLVITWNVLLLCYYFLHSKKSEKASLQEDDGDWVKIMCWFLVAALAKDIASPCAFIVTYGENEWKS